LIRFRAIPAQVAISVTEKEDPRGRSALDDLRIVDPGALQGDPFARKSGVLASLRSSGRGFVAAAIAVGVLVLAWRFSVPVSQQVAGTPNTPSTSGAPGSAATGGSHGSVPVSGSAPATAAGPVRLQAAKPAELKARLVEELRAAGVEAIGYDRLDLSGVDAKLPDPVPEAVRTVLDRHGIPLPADGIVRVEIAESR
jgi:hypothetical protein